MGKQFYKPFLNSWFSRIFKIRKIRILDLWFDQMSNS